MPIFEAWSDAARSLRHTVQNGSWQANMPKLPGSLGNHPAKTTIVPDRASSALGSCKLPKSSQTLHAASRASELGKPQGEEPLQLSVKRSMHSKWARHESQGPASRPVAPTFYPERFCLNPFEVGTWNQRELWVSDFDTECVVMFYARWHHSTSLV